MRRKRPVRLFTKERLTISRTRQARQELSKAGGLPLASIGIADVYKHSVSRRGLRVYARCFHASASNCWTLLLRVVDQSRQLQVFGWRCEEGGIRPCASGREKYIDQERRLEVIKLELDRGFLSRAATGATYGSHSNMPAGVLVITGLRKPENKKS